MMEDLSNNQPQCATGDVMLTMSPAYLVGLRFTNVVFNTSEPLSGVYIEWTAGADSAENDSVEITFYGELKASPPYLDCYLPFNLSSRVRTVLLRIRCVCGTITLTYITHRRTPLLPGVYPRGEKEAFTAHQISHQSCKRSSLKPAGKVATHLCFL